MASSACYSPNKEVPNLSLARPADVTIPVWCEGHKTAFDVSVVSLVPRCAPGPGSCLPRCRHCFPKAIQMPHSCRRLPWTGNPLCSPCCGDLWQVQARTGRGIHELPKVSPGPAMPNPYTPCGRATPDGLTPLRPQDGQPAAVFYPLGYPTPNGPGWEAEFGSFLWSFQIVSTPQ
jgi:hypothetical protein